MVSDPVEVARITITRTIDDDHDTVNVECSDGLRLVEALGMIGMAQAVVLENFDTDPDRGPDA